VFILFPRALTSHCFLTAALFRFATRFSLVSQENGVFLLLDFCGDKIGSAEIGVKVELLDLAIGV
jgi:hypothetical protein